MAYSAELRLALRTVHRASLLTKSVLRSLQNHVSAETKADDSPVTIADFAAQALLISALHAVYPQDAFLGEESADALRQNEQLADRVWQLALRAKEEAQARESEKGDGQQNVQDEDGFDGKGLAFPASKEEMFDLIDRGGKGEVTGRGRVWVMDPVDGTATFMQGQQYAVCLCLLVDGVQQVGVIGCPNLAFDIQGPLGQTSIHEDQVDQDGYGVVLSAVKGQGTYIRSMTASSLGEARHIDLTTLPPKKPSDLNFVEATLGKTSLSQPEHNAVAASLGAQWPGTILWSQQLKYVALTLGATDVMVRIPKTLDRFTYIWDHAGGHLLFQEAGGVISDFNGEQIDFTQGRKITGERNWGMIATMPGLFEAVGRAVKEVLGRRSG
jgi:3'(2'), 5'-bisphosphate nucleotidase